MTGNHRRAITRRSAQRRVTAVAALLALLLTACDGSPHRATRSGSPARSSAARGQDGAGTAPSKEHTVVPVPSNARYGAIIARRVAAESGFRPRPLLLYVPHDLPSRSRGGVPVLELLHGTPGQPADWFTRGGLLGTVEAFAAAHHGRAPLVVLPDINGSRGSDSECIRTSSGQDVERYLTQDVVNYVRRTFARAIGHARWWIAGLSEGGICAAMLALRHPGTYSAFGDLSGLSSPTVDHVSPAASDQQLFGGSARARNEHDPVWLLRHHRYPNLHAWFTAGASDLKVKRAQSAVAAAARAAGIPVRAQLLPGKHQWSVWGPALRAMLPWLWAEATG